LATTALFRDIRLLFPPFYESLSQGLALARQDGHPIEIFETFRSPARQQLLFDLRPKVTNSLPWQSWHQYGMAADIALRVNGKWSWEFDPAKIARYFEGLPIKWGGPNDGPHYQWSKLPQISAAKAIVAENNSVLAFWASLL
jgi:hypothetical protein